MPSLLPDTLNMDKLTTHAAYITSGATLIAGGLSLNDYLAIGGFCLAVITCIVNWYYKRKNARIFAEEVRKHYGLSQESDDEDN